MNYEYRVYHLDRGEDLETAINRETEGEWELHNTAMADSDNPSAGIAYTLIFRRPD